MQINNGHTLGYALWFRLGYYSVFHIEIARVNCAIVLQPISEWILTGVVQTAMKKKDSLVSKKNDV